MQLLAVIVMKAEAACKCVYKIMRNIVNENSRDIEIVNWILYSCGQWPNIIVWLNIKYGSSIIKEGDNNILK
jgi:hypothetical protein